MNRWMVLLSRGYWLYFWEFCVQGISIIVKTKYTIFSVLILHCPLFIVAFYKMAADQTRTCLSCQTILLLDVDEHDSCFQCLGLDHRWMASLCTSCEHLPGEELLVRRLRACVWRESGADTPPFPTSRSALRSLLQQIAQASTTTGRTLSQEFMFLLTSAEVNAPEGVVPDAVWAGTGGPASQTSVEAGVAGIVVPAGPYGPQVPEEGMACQSTPKVPRQGPSSLGGRPGPSPHGVQHLSDRSFTHSSSILDDVSLEEPVLIPGRCQPLARPPMGPIPVFAWL